MPAWSFSINEFFFLRKAGQRSSEVKKKNSGTLGACDSGLYMGSAALNYHGV